MTRALRSAEYHEPLGRPRPELAPERLRLDLHPAAPERWAKRERHGTQGPGVYTWPELAERLQRLRGSRRRDEAVFIRHGATKYNLRGRVSGQHNTVLSDLGRQQAHALERSLDRPLDLIVCSTLARTIQTMQLALPASRRDGVPIFIDRRLNEVHLGKMQGRRRAFVPAFGTGDLDFAPAGGETYRSAAQRTFSSVIDIFEALQGEGGRARHAAVFCHAGILRLVATLTREVASSQDLFRVNLSNAERLVVAADKLSLAPIWEWGDRQA